MKRITHEMRDAYCRYADAGWWDWSFNPLMESFNDAMTTVAAVLFAPPDLTSSDDPLDFFGDSAVTEKNAAIRDTIAPEEVAA